LPKHYLYLLTLDSINIFKSPSGDLGVEKGRGCETGHDLHAAQNFLPTQCRCTGSCSPLPQLMLQSYEKVFEWASLVTPKSPAGDFLHASLGEGR